MFEAYAARDVIYLMGQNDTCNEYLTPHCQSHGLDKSCAGMLEGHFRRERAENYMKYLTAFFGRPVHSGSLVPVRAALVLQPVLPVDFVQFLLAPLVMPPLADPASSFVALHCVIETEFTDESPRCRGWAMITRTCFSRRKV
jgi:hypothetical protein|eukprot:COSAG02_NODE_2979_length_7625_cov_73.716715_7_plen_142_part_00